jgi:hypothetical protein
MDTLDTIKKEIADGNVSKDQTAAYIIIYAC